MGCTCSAPAHCPVCNASVRVPLTNLERAAAATGAGARPPSRTGSPLRNGFSYLIEGSSACPSCGHSVRVHHSRPCVAEALAGVGLSAKDRAALLARITFPEG